MSASALWDFAVAIYDCADVKPLCLRLQDKHSADCCLLLALLWAGRGGHIIGAYQCASLAMSIASWQHSMTGQLRGLRRTVGALARHCEEGNDPVQLDTLYRALQQSELAAERCVFDQLCFGIRAIGPPTLDGSGDAMALSNVGCYLDGLELPASTYAAALRVLASALKQVAGSGDG